MKHVYHVGDVVKIVEPKIVSRVGYPLTLEEGIKAASEKWQAQVEKLMKDIRGVETNADWFDCYDSRLYNDLLQALGKYYLRSVGFGGRERTIHTETIEKLRGLKEWKVVSKRCVKTGTWSPGYVSSDGDYDPPYLANEKTHVLLSIAWQGNGFSQIEHDYEWTVYDRVEIESDNVAPI